MTATPSLDTLLVQMSALTAALPARCPTTLRVGPDVLAELKRQSKPSSTGPVALGVRIFEDDTYTPGLWRVFDQSGDEISRGVIPVPGATIDIALEGGTRKAMRVMTVSRDDTGRITEYTLADAALVDGMSFMNTWLFDEGDRP